MKNVIIGVLAIVLVVSMSYGSFQKGRADQNELKVIELAQIAREMNIRAEQQMKIAIEQKRIAEMNKLEAMQQKQIAEKAALDKKK